MAIYSLNLRSIGRTTHAAGTAGAHILYIARPDAKAVLVAEHMPLDPNEARAWVNRAETADRKNARVVDKVRIALPRELSPEQRMQLLQDFAQDLTGGRVPWFAGIHAEGKDAHNPHCHLVIRDRDIETGKRVLRLSDSARDRGKAGLEPKAVEWVRTMWEHHANRALEEAGHDVRIDRRSLEAQGIDREPTIHIGPQASHVEDFVQRPHSKKVETGSGRVINYPQIDEGRTRKDRHAEIVDLNLEKAARSKNFRIRETAKFERAERAKDRALEQALAKEARRRTREARQLRGHARGDLTAARSSYRSEMSDIRAMAREDWTSKRAALTERHQAERDALKKDQGRISSRLLRAIDLTGRSRHRQDADREALQARQKDERHALVQSHRATVGSHTEALKSRYTTIKREIRAQYRPEMEAMRNRHAEAEKDADRQRQMRAAERDQAANRLDQTITKIERSYLSSSQRRDRDHGPSIG